MDGYGLPYSVMAPLFRFATSVPFYAVADIGVDA